MRYLLGEGDCSVYIFKTSSEQLGAGNPNLGDQKGKVSFET